MNYLATILLLLLPSFLIPTQPDKDLSGIQIVEHLTYHGDEINAGDLDVSLPWYAIIRTENDTVFQISKVQLVLLRVHDELLDTDESERTGIEVVSNLDSGYEKVVMYIGGMQLQPGLIYGQVYKMEWPYLVSGQARTFPVMRNDSFQLVASGSQQNCSVTYRYHDKEQMLADSMFLEDNMPHPIFSADLDKDGKHDLIMNMTHHYNVSDIHLFLSSKAEKGKLLKSVASRYSVGC